MKTKQDNDVTDHRGAVYAENKTKLLWLTNRVQSMKKTR